MPAEKRNAVGASLMHRRNVLVRQPHRGEFWKPCPGTGAGYYCCGYQVLSPLTGCGMYCRYCILQVYFEQQHQVLFTNLDDLAAEVHLKMKSHNGRVVRLGTGEFADSLYLEPRLGLCASIASLFEPYPNVLIEFKTKSANIPTLDRIRNPSKCVVGFSLNTPDMVRRYERGTASIKARLEAARRCEQMGFWVSFHFDPMIWYPDWHDGYRRLVDQVFSSVRDASRIAWWSLGGFRTPPSLKAYLKERGEHLPLFEGEMVLGEDRKLRYFRPIRAEFYRAVQEQIEKHSPATTVYLCMESRDVWGESGMLKRIPQGLVHYLDMRARQMLGI